MLAMLLDAPGRPLRAAEVPMPAPEPGQVLLRVLACGVCRTDLHIVDGELTLPVSGELVVPRIPGHQIVGEIIALGKESKRFAVGDRVG